MLIRSPLASSYYCWGPVVSLYCQNKNKTKLLLCASYRPYLVLYTELIAGSVTPHLALLTGPPPPLPVSCQPPLDLRGQASSRGTCGGGFGRDLPISKHLLCMWGEGRWLRLLSSSSPPRWSLCSGVRLSRFIPHPDLAAQSCVSPGAEHMLLRSRSPPPSWMAEQ